MAQNTGRFKKGQSPWNKDIELPQMSGSKHPNWKGGKNTIEYKCLDCDNFKSTKKTLRCLPCKATFQSGENTYQYKGGKPKCLDCGILTTQYRSKRCHSCYLKSMKGESSPNWKGGVTPISYRVRTSKKMKDWIFSVMKRDNFLCKMCATNSNSLEVHHIKPFHRIVEEIQIRYGKKNLFKNIMKSNEIWNLDNGRTLCTQCHSMVDSYRNRFTSLIVKQ